MHPRRWLVLFAALFVGVCLTLFAEEKAPAVKKGYTVVLDLHINEAGVADDATIVSSEDTSVDRVLEHLAMETARGVKLPPRLKDGKAVKFTARAPYVFPVEDDEGPDANHAPKPSIRSAIQPVYPAELAEKGEVGGVIMELMIGADGAISTVKVLRSSHPEFEQAATLAVKQWVFSPAKKDGVPVNGRWRIAVSFETDVLRAEWKWRLAPRPSLGSYTVVRRTLPDEPAPAAVPTPARPEEKPAGQ